MDRPAPPPPPPPPAPCFFYSDPAAAAEYVATECCVGPWSPELLHAGPPGALLARCLEAEGAARGLPLLVRVTTELLRPLPVARFRVAVRAVRAGRKVAHLEATLLLAGEKDPPRELMRASGCLMRRAPLGDCPAPGAAGLRGRSPLAAGGPPNGGPGGLPPPEFEVSDFGYGLALEARAAEYTAMSGASDLWFRSRVPLVLPLGSDVAAPSGAPEGDAVAAVMSPVSLLMLVADSVGGMSYFVDPMDTVFMNADMTLNVLRPPESPWICMSSRTDVTAKNGTGLASGVIYDTEGPSAMVSASLLMEARASSHL